MNLQEKLIYLRKRKGLTQSDLAETLNVTRQAISRWEVGTAVPSTDNLKILSELYGVSADYLLNDSENDASRKIECPYLPQTPFQVDADKKAVRKSRSIWIISLVSTIGILVVVITLLIGSLQKRESDSVVPVENMETIEEDNYQAGSFLLE